jgi:hypothetical protein
VAAIAGIIGPLRTLTGLTEVAALVVIFFVGAIGGAELRERLRRLAAEKV